MADIGGNLWRGTLQIANESSPGIFTPSTRKLYVRDPKLVRERPARLHKYMVQRRDNTRAVTNGPVTAAGSYVHEMSADEIIETFLLSIQGGVTPTGGGDTQTWEFTAGGEDLDFASYEWHDGANVWNGSGYRINQVKIAGNANGENLVTCDLFGDDVEIGTLTEDLDERVPLLTEGWETLFKLGDFGDDPDSTSEVDAFLINWEITLMNNLGRKYHAQNQNAQTGTTSGELGVEAKFLIEASAPEATQEFDNWSTTPPTLRLVRLEFGNNAVIGGGPDLYVVKLDMPGTWTAFDLAQSDAGTRCYQVSYSAVFEPTSLQSMFRAIVLNDRDTPWV